MASIDASFGDELVALYAKYEGARSRDSGAWEHRPDPEAFWREKFETWGLKFPSGDPIDASSDCMIRSRLEAFLRRARPCDVSELDALLSDDDDVRAATSPLMGGAASDAATDLDPFSPRTEGSAGGGFLSDGADECLSGGSASFASAPPADALPGGAAEAAGAAECAPPPQAPSRSSGEERAMRVCEAMSQHMPDIGATDAAEAPFGWTRAGRGIVGNLVREGSGGIAGSAGGGLPLWLRGTWYVHDHPTLPAGAVAHYHKDGSFEGHAAGVRGRVVRVQSSDRGDWIEVGVVETGSASEQTIAMRPAPPPCPTGWLLTCHHATSADPPDRFPDDPGQHADLTVGLWRPAVAPVAWAAIGSPQRRRGGVDMGTIPPALDNHTDWLRHPASGLALLPRGAWGGRLDRPDGLVAALHALPCSVAGRWGIRRPRRLLITPRRVLVCSTMRGGTQVEAALPVAAVTAVWTTGRKGDSFCDLTVAGSPACGDISVRADKEKAHSAAATLRRLQGLMHGHCPPGSLRGVIVAFAFACTRRRLLVPSHVALVAELAPRDLKVRAVADEDLIVPAPRPVAHPPATVHFPWDLPVLLWDEVSRVLPTEESIRFRLDAFYRTFTGQSTSSFGPSDSAKVDVLVDHVLEGRHPLDRVLDKMSEKHDAPAEEWRGRLPVGLVRFHLLAICRHHDPSCKGVPPLLPRGRIARAHVVDHLARKVCGGEFCLTDVVRRLCRLWSSPPDDWLGEYPPALKRDCEDLSLAEGGDSPEVSEDALRFLVDAFYLTISPGDISKAEGLCDHVTSGRHPLRRVVAVMCEKYAANLTDWAGLCPPGPLRYRLDCLIGRNDPLYEGVPERYGPGPVARSQYVEKLTRQICSPHHDVDLESCIRDLCTLWSGCDAEQWLAPYPEALRPRGSAAHG